MKRLETFGILAILLALIVNSFLHGGDFDVFYLAGQRTWHGLPIYLASDAYFPFKYHPAWGWFFVPLTIASRGGAIVLWTMLMMAAWWSAASQWCEWLGYKWDRRSQFIVLLVSLNAFSAETGYGQINGLLFWGATQIFGWLDGEKRRPWAAGIMIVVLTSLKLNFGLLALYGVMRDRRSVGGMALGAVLMHLSIVAGFSNVSTWEMYQQWLGLLVGQSSDQFYMFESQGFLNFFHALFGEWARQLWLLSIGVMVGAGYWFLRRPFPAAPAFWMACLFLLSPLPWWYHILYMYPMAFYLLRQALPVWQKRCIQAGFFLFNLASFNFLGHDGVILFKAYHGFFWISLMLLAMYVTGELRAPQRRSTAV